MPSESELTHGTGERPRAWWRGAKGVRRVLFCIVWAVLAAECYLRVLAPVAFLPRYVEATDFGVRRNTPSLTYWHRTPEYRIQIRTNAAGIRADREFSYEKPAGTRRIVVLGDSFGLGYGVDLEDTFLSRMHAALEPSLAERGVECEIINLSVSGFGNAEQLVMLQEEGLRYAPDLVLVAWHSSDFSDNVRSDLFELDDEGGVRRKAESYLPGMKLRKRLADSAVYRWVASHSHLYVWSREFLARVVKAALFRFERARGEPAPQAASVAYEPRFYPNPYELVGELTIGLLLAMQAEAAEVGARFLVLDIPDHASRIDFSTRFPRSPDGESFGIEVVSPLEAFEEHVGELLFWERSHRHMTPLACGLTGAALAERILELDLLDLE